MNTVIATTNFIILAAIALIHYYWAAGGRWAASKVVPHKVDNMPLFKPGTLASILVGSFMLVIAVYQLSAIPILHTYWPQWVLHHGFWILGLIFMIRTIGEFRYVGFFKRVKHSQFAALDTRFYSPLCLYLSISCFYLGIF